MKLTKKIVAELKEIYLVVRASGDGESESVTRKSAWEELKNAFRVCKGSPYNMMAIELANDLDRFSQGENKTKQIIAWLKNNIYELSYGYVFSVLTDAEENEREQEKEREEIERAAAEFARECGSPVGSPEYIRSLNKAINKLNAENEMVFSDESRMERFAACRFAGCSDSYYSDEDYISNQQNKKQEYLERIHTWLENNCPLLMAKVNQTEE